MAATWTDEEKDAVIKAYLAAEPTGENSVEIVKGIAEEYERPANGVRMILSKANVYVKKEVTPTKATAAEGDKPKRVSKADSIAELTSAITDAGQEPDSEILDKLTGKAAQYFTSVIRGMQSTPETEEE
jgi:hypothetical protein